MLKVFGGMVNRPSSVDPVRLSQTPVSVHPSRTAVSVHPSRTAVSVPWTFFRFSAWWQPEARNGSPDRRPTDPLNHLEQLELKKSLLDAASFDAAASRNQAIGNRTSGPIVPKPFQAL